MARSRLMANVWASSGMLTGPHQTSASGVRVLDDPLVLGRAARLHAGIGDQRAVVGDAGVLLVANGVLVEGTRREVAVNFRNGQSVLFEVEVAHRVPPADPLARKAGTWGREQQAPCRTCGEGARRGLAGVWPPICSESLRPGRPRGGPGQRHHVIAVTAKGLREVSDAGRRLRTVLRDARSRAEGTIRVSSHQRHLAHHGKRRVERTGRQQERRDHPGLDRRRRVRVGRRR